MRWPIALASGAAILAAAAPPALALPVTVTRVDFDDAARRLTLDVTGDAEIRARQLDRRILLEIPDSRLRGGTLALPVASRRVRSILVSEVAGRPSFVRVEVALAPGIEPVLTMQKSAGRLYVILADPPPAEGERDLEVHPERPAGAVPELVDRGSRQRAQPEPIEVPGGFAVAAPPAAPVAAAVAAPRPGAAVLPRSPVVVRAAPPQQPQLARASGTRSYALLTFQQVEAAERIPGKSLSGFPTGPAGLEVQHWLWSFLGVGGEARYLSWTGKGDLTLARQDALVIVRAGARLPLPYFEPELYVAGAQRWEVAPTHSGIDPPTLALGGGFRLQPADAIGLRIWGQLFPFGIGLDKLWRAGASFLVDAGPVLLSIGYTHDDKAVLGGATAYEAAVVGAGVQW